MQFNTLALFASIIVSNVASLKDGCKQISKSPIYDCGKPTDLLKIKEVSFSPEHPVQNQDAKVHVKGILKKTINKGAKVKYTLTFNGAKVASGDSDICESLEKNKAKVQCPIKNQEFDFTENFKIPGTVPNGTYTLESVGTQGKDQIFSLYSDYKL